MSETESPSDIAALTVQLLSSYLSNNTVASEDLAGLIRSTKEALAADGPASAEVPEPEAFTPAVSVRKSLASPEHIISLIDGRPYRTLKRHLTAQGLTPDDYRSRYNLPANYPMVAPAYSEHRRDVARKIGLGNRKPEPDVATAEGNADVADPIALEAVPAEASPEPKKRQPKSASAKAKAPARKPKDATPAEIAAEEAPAPEPTDTADAPTPVSEDDAIAPKASKARTPRQPKTASSAKPARAAKTPKAERATAQAAAEPDAASAAAPSNDGAKPAKPPRRGKLGLFGKVDDGAQPVDGASTPTDAEPAVATSSPAKRGRPKRMARTPESPPVEPGT